MHIPTVGEQVRVISKDKSFSSRAIISDCGPNGTFDVIFNDTQQGDEEIAVPSDRITPLEPFEKDAAENFIDAELLKSHGNVLFTLKDFSAALEYYKKAIRAADIASSSPEVFSTGQCVLVSFQNSIDYQTGIISDVDTGTGAADIMFDDDTLEEEVAIPFSRLQPLPAARKDRLLHRSVYMNMARSVLKKEQKGWAIKYSSIALAIARHFQAQLREADSSEAGTVSSPTEVSKMLADGYYFRGKTLLMACRPKFATQVLVCLRTILRKHTH